MDRGITIQRFVLMLAILLMTGSPPLEAGGSSPGVPAPQPYLRIETGMHTAPIRGIATDREGRFLVTGSHDQTVRIWDVASSRLLKTLHPPFLDSGRGKIYSVALSPDGQTIAAGGLTRASREVGHSIFLFDRASGALRLRIDKVPNVVFELAFSPDGTRLAAALADNLGIQIYDVRDGSTLASDGDYQGEPYGLAFDRRGRLLTTAADGFVRLYDPSVQRVARVKAPDGGRPAGVAISPDETVAAVAYYDSPRVDVLGMNDLELRYSADTSSVLAGNLAQVTWSRDGSSLYAGGSHLLNGICPVFRWPDRGKGVPTKTEAGLNTITGLVPVAGGVLFGSDEPNWGMITDQGQRTRYAVAAIGDFRENFERFRLDVTGQQVMFTFSRREKQPSLFSLSRRSIERALPDEPMQPPLTGMPGVKLSDWQNAYNPKVNGQPFSMMPREYSRAAAITPDGREVVLGTDWNLRMHDVDGRERWRVATPSVVRRVNVTGDGGLVVAALGDGTIRWYRRLDGRELLALFPHVDRERWVVWTPSGFYDASPGGEDLIGWRIYQGADRAADFFPASLLRATYYRPDIIDRILVLRDEAEARRQADAARPPEAVAASSPVVPGAGGVAAQTSSDAASAQTSSGVAASGAAAAQTSSDAVAAAGSSPAGSSIPSGRTETPVAQSGGATPPPGGVAIEGDDGGTPGDLAAPAAPLDPSFHQMLPPVVSLLSPEEGTPVSSTSVVLVVRIRSASDLPVTEVRPTVDGRLLRQGWEKLEVRPVGPPGREQEEQEWRLRVTIPERDCNVGVVARTELSTWSSNIETQASLRWTKPAALPDLYVLAIGVGTYGSSSQSGAGGASPARAGSAGGERAGAGNADTGEAGSAGQSIPSLPPLWYARKDAEDFVALMRAQEGRLYRRVIVQTLLDHDATRANVLDKLQWLEQQPTDHDLSMLFIAGHGVSMRGNYYFVPVDGDPSREKATLVSKGLLLDTFQNMRGRVVLVLDTCYAGSAADSRLRGLRPVEEDEFLRELSVSSNEMVYLAASSRSQSARELSELHNGLFTYSLLEGLRGKAPHDGQYIRLMDLFRFARSEVERLSVGQQTPIFWSPAAAQNYPIAVVGR